MRIDLHTHSTASDGTLSPAALMTAASDAGLDVVALTDHDTVAGWAPASAAVPAGLTLLPGIEISARWPDTAGVNGGGIGVHLLAYLPDPEHPALAAELARLRAGRTDRGARMVALLRAAGIDVTWDEVRADADGGSVGRPHLARALVRHGLVATMDEAFAPEWLGGRFQLPKDEPAALDAVALVRDAGGVPVLAHALAHLRGRTVPPSAIGEMAAAGLAGLEADHPSHDRPARARLRAIADTYGLFVTGASDFHGDNKTVRLAAELTAPEALERIVALGTGAAPVTGGTR